MSIRRFKQDFLYDYAIPPYGFDYQTMTKKEAEEHFNWFLAEIPNRINYLESFCGNKVNLDFSYESLIDLWKFFLSVGRTEPIPKDELKELRTQFKAFGDDFVGTEQLSVSTEYLVRDIGIYLSEVYKKILQKFIGILLLNLNHISLLTDLCLPVLLTIITILRINANVIRFIWLVFKRLDYWTVAQMYMIYIIWL